MQVFGYGIYFTTFNTLRSRGFTPEDLDAYLGCNESKIKDIEDLKHHVYTAIAEAIDTEIANDVFPDILFADIPLPSFVSEEFYFKFKHATEIVASNAFYARLWDVNFSICDGEVKHFIR